MTNHSLREAIVGNNMTKMQEAQSRIEMALEAKKRSSSQLEELKAKKQKLKGNDFSLMNDYS